MSGENHHWVPQFLLKKFADKDGRVYFLDVQTDTLGKRTPRLLASEAGFNDFTVDGEFVSYETELQRIETKAAPAISKVVKQRSTTGITSKELDAIASFVSVQGLRTKSFRAGLESDSPGVAFGEMFRSLLSSAMVEARQIRARPMIALIAPQGHGFYLSDHPVTLQHIENPASREPLGFDLVGTEIFMPASPRVALYWPCPKIAREIVDAYAFAQQTHRRLRSVALGGPPVPGLEQMSLREMQQCMIGLAPMRNAIVLGHGVDAPMQVIENANYLQCVWAHGAIFSDSRDFSFALRVLSENPQYRGVPAVRLLQKGILIERSPNGDLSYSVEPSTVATCPGR